MVRFVDECDHPRVKANIDISHLVLADVGPGELKEIERQSDSRASERLRRQGARRLAPRPRRGEIRAISPAIKELAIDGVVAIELEYAPDPKKVVQWVEEAYGATAKLMDLAGLRKSPMKSASITTDSMPARPRMGQQTGSNRSPGPLRDPDATPGPQHKNFAPVADKFAGEARPQPRTQLSARCTRTARSQSSDFARGVIFFGPSGCRHIGVNRFRFPAVCWSKRDR